MLLLNWTYSDSSKRCWWIHNGHKFLLNSNAQTALFMHRFYITRICPWSEKDTFVELNSYSDLQYTPGSLTPTPGLKNCKEIARKVRFTFRINNKVNLQIKVTSALHIHIPVHIHVLKYYECVSVRAKLAEWREEMDYYICPPEVLKYMPNIHFNMLPAVLNLF